MTRIGGPIVERHPLDPYNISIVSIGANLL
jgi:hypothetical protein